MLGEHEIERGTWMKFLKVRIIQIFEDNMTQYDYENQIGKHFSLGATCS
jgi:hypothetical protein